MPLWGSLDAANNSVKSAVQQYNMSVTSANANLLYQNTTANAFVAGMTVGQFHVSSDEVTADANGHGYHAGWVLRKVGSGLRAGRVTIETLVAAGSYSSVNDKTDSSIFPDYRLVINVPPTSNSAQTANVTFSVSAASLPDGATLNYKWQRTYAGATSWVDVPNTTGTWFNNTSPTLTANAVTANANTLRVMVYATGTGSANVVNVYSANVTVTKLP